ncbi:ectoine/hydroxyectoine ABC transporter permease subunit EhuD [Streptomyces sp. NBS 14/10]|uniref:ectoine/hydroxyectoine ABC transporter permease subunit EhuD n=1 Tax=Streptomyces sp. NBS 14/10 TaxID=1945643 RepID=UPI000B7E82B9|nr:ectoine/hydroxyectoine ABC transporter permease subunit EhuD [Streptomyces sp. NBS 14/10]KAK1179485.1 ectoine/hydroxyectoine ABC transporter permease subunit EhuD [Streptomyces sp. NBS 14/10]NUP44579.1 ectoine/hydroxyectoine ABC transporter permease subunit EhuD [Streptomyces sp.]NUS83284.1 ectoine/hydroxyectoine ABC transporter permease subunit EhuD [Streptomyces sp.]
MNWDWNVAKDFLPQLGDGLLITLEATALGSVLSFALGLVWALAFRSPTRFVRWPVAAVVEFIRNTPLLVQLFFFYYVLPTWDIKFSALTTGVIALGLHYSTYTAEVYRAGIDGVPKGQWEACTALSLSRGRTWISVILPQAIRRVVPALGNYVIAMLKDSPMLALIGVVDMLQKARAHGATSFEYIEPYTMVGIAFILIAYPASLLMRALERRLGH